MTDLNYNRITKPMTLGTVNFGMPYGITNSYKKVSKKIAIQIIRKAIMKGVEYIDTASNYGESEEVIGLALLGGLRNRVKLITKISPLEKKEILDVDVGGGAIKVRDSFDRSCLKLKTKKIDVLMFHRYCDTLIPSCINEVLTIKKKGGFDSLGVSIETPEELNAVLSNKIFNLVQLPFNIFDYRWNNLFDKVLAVKKKRNLIIHARSSLLQGLLCSNNSTNFLKAGISNYKDVIKFLKIYYKKYQRTSVADLCLGYANSQHWIDSVVVGVRSISNLYSNIKSISMPSLTDNCLKDINKERPKIHEQSLNPRLWS